MTSRKLFPPEPEVNLYNQGFGSDDPFNRISTGKSLSELVDRIEDPLVIALDGPWGSGKSWFLKRWVGAHRLENEGRAKTVYFDAFAHDFMDDPLISLVGVIGDEIQKQTPPAAWKNVKTAAAKLSKPIARIAMSVVTGGVSEITGPILDAAIESTGKEIEKAAETYWAREDGKRVAMQQLRAALVELTIQGGTEAGNAVPLVVVVDELDRCRPDYAVALLEVIKHFFSVPKVHFILGVNIDALEHSVRIRYGASFDSNRYLRRFISLTTTLPNYSNDHHSKSSVLEYFRKSATAMKINAAAVNGFAEHLEMILSAHLITMRDINQALIRLSLIDPKLFSQRKFAKKELTLSMLLFSICEPRLQQKAIDQTLSSEEVMAFYGIKPQPVDMTKLRDLDFNRFLKIAVWSFVINGSSRNGFVRSELLDAFEAYEIEEPWRLPRQVYRDYLSRFVIPSIAEAKSSP